MVQIKVGANFKTTQTVTTNKLASFIGSGTAEVFATPMMLALMENAAFNCLNEFLDESETSVGTAISSSHISATPVGLEVYAVAEITAADGRKIDFKIEAFDSCGKIGEGTHSRFVVDKLKFMQKVNSKK